MSRKRRQYIFTMHCTAEDVAPCCVCDEPIHRNDDRWIVEHVRPLGLLGEDNDANCKPAHYLCGIAKSATDARRIAKAKRQAKALPKGKNAPAARPESKQGFWKPENAFWDWRKRRYIIVRN
jgi:hypothetical protein